MPIHTNRMKEEGDYMEKYYKKCNNSQMQMEENFSYGYARNIRENFDNPTISFKNNSNFKCRFTAVSTKDNHILLYNDYNPGEGSFIHIPVGSGVKGICEVFGKKLNKPQNGEIKISQIKIGELCQFALNEYSMPYEQLNFEYNIRTVGISEDEEAKRTYNNAQFRVINVTNITLSNKDTKDGGYPIVVKVTAPSVYGEATDYDLLRPAPKKLLVGEPTATIPIPNVNEKDGIVCEVGVLIPGVIDEGYKIFYKFIPKIERGILYDIYVHSDEFSNNPRFDVKETELTF